jgi:hypothetical protein
MIFSLLISLTRRHLRNKTRMCNAQCFEPGVSAMTSKN